jgi:hypothetical protein
MRGERLRPTAVCTWLVCKSLSTAANIRVTNGWAPDSGHGAVVGRRVDLIEHMIDNHRYGIRSELDGDARVRAGDLVVGGASGHER